MSYEVIARKWRPGTFDDVVGQEHVTRTLKNAIASKRMAHAYLFVGPRGTGKTSIARIFAKALNCEHGPTDSPCGKCDSCKEIAAGTSFDVIEIDGASNNSVDQIRDLRDTVVYAPARGQFKIYIIDEVHMLSASAFNALLKTLEEPPAHVKFFFATTEPDKVLPTIISRCQRFDFRRIPVIQIVERLRLIAKAEKVTIDDDALLAIARGAEGGLRDAESALDQLISFKGKKITEEDVLSVFGLVSREKLELLADAILQSDSVKILELIADLDDAGKDLTRLLSELMVHFRNLMVFVCAGQKPKDITDAQEAVIVRQAKGLDVERVLRILDIFSDVSDKMRFTLSRRLQLETGLIRAGRAVTAATLEEIFVQLNKLKSGVGYSEPETENAVIRETPTVQHPKSEPRAKTTVQPKPKSAPAVADPNRFEAELENLKTRWKEVLSMAQPLSQEAPKLLLDAVPVKVEQDAVTMAFDEDFASQIKRFDDRRNRKAVEHALSVFLKRSVAAKFVTATGVLAGSRVASDAKLKTEPGVADNPVVQKALDMFGGTIVDIRE